MSMIKINCVSRIFQRIVLGGSVLLSGCIVWPTTYYEPLTEGQTSPAGCGGGPSNILTTQIADGVSATLYVSSWQLAGVSAQFKVPATKTLRLINLELKILDRNGSVIHELPISYLTDTIRDQYGYRQVRRRPSDLLQGGTVLEEWAFGSREIYRGYNAGLKSLENLPDYIQIQLPEMEINGKRIKPEPIRFEKTTWIFLYAFNC